MERQPIPLLVPQRGLQRSQLPHQVGNDAVVSGQNMLLTLDGRYGCRPGYEQYGNSAITERLLGGVYFRDALLASRFVFASPTSWYTYNSSDDSWVDITDPSDPLTGDDLTPVRFTTFFQDDLVWALAVNDSDTTKKWSPGLSIYQDVPASPPARDITTLANRIVVVNTLEAGIRNASRVRWSAEADATIYPPLGFFDFDNAGELNIAIRNLSRTTAAVYRTQSIWLVTAQAGGDATAFAPEQVATGIDGPLGASAVVAVGRFHYYMGRDAKVYRFDGVEPTAISTPIDRLLDLTLSRDLGSIVHGTWYAPRRQIWWWVTAQDESAPQSAFVYDLDTQQWEVEQRFTVGVTTSVRGEEQRSGTWDSDDATWDSDESSWNSDLSESAIILLFGTADGRVMNFGRAPADTSEPISFTWTLPIIYAGETSKLLSSEVESFFTQITTEDAPTVNVSVYGLFHPLGERILLFSGNLDVSILGRLIASSGRTDFDTTNLYPALQVEYSGTTFNAEHVEWGGGTLQVYTEKDD